MSDQYSNSNLPPQMVNQKQQLPFLKKSLFNHKLIFAIFIFLLFFLGFLTKDYIFPKPGMMTIIGEGKILVQPEIARFTVSWIGSGNSASQAMQNERELLNNFMVVLQNYGVAKQDVQVAYARLVSVQGNYQAVNAMDVKLNKVEKLSEAITALYSNGARSVANIGLSVNNPDELEEKAISEAIKDAQTKAEKIAKASKKELGRLISLTPGTTGDVSALTSQAGSQTKGSQQDQSGSGFGDLGTENRKEEQPKQFSQESAFGQIKISRKVSVIYEIK